MRRVEFDVWRTVQSPISAGEREVGELTGLAPAAERARLSSGDTAPSAETQRLLSRGVLRLWRRSRGGFAPVNHFDAAQPNRADPSAEDVAGKR